MNVGTQQVVDDEPKPLPNVLLHLDFVTQDPGNSWLTKNLWQETSIEVPMILSTTALERIIGDAVVTNLRDDNALLDILEEEDAILLYSAEVLEPFCGGMTFWLQESKHSVQALSDLFENPRSPGRGLSITVELDMSYRPMYDTEQPSEKINNLEAELEDTADRVVEQRRAKPDDDGWEYVCIRLGTVHAGEEAPIPQRRKKVADRQKHPSTSDAHEQNAPGSPHVSIPGSCEQTPVGYYTRGHMSTTSDLKLISVPAWNFGDYYIGDCDHHWDWHSFSRNDNYMQEYAGVKNLSELHKRIQKQLRKDPNPAFPFIPSCTLNMYDPTACKMGVMGELAEVVSRFVNHLEMKPVESVEPVEVKPDELVLPWNVQYALDFEETSAAITTYLTEELQRGGLNQSADEGVLVSDRHVDAANTHLLFERPLKDAWSLQLWVLPQLSDVKKLYRYPTGRADSRNRLGEFLAPHKVLAGDRRLYMEAHIVPNVL